MSTGFPIIQILEHPKKEPKMLEFPLCKKNMVHMCKWDVEKRGEICEKRTYESGKKDEQLQKPQM